MQKCPLFVESKYYKEYSNKEKIDKARELAQLFQEIRKDNIEIKWI